MSNLPGETPRQDLSAKQMEVLEGFIKIHKTVSNVDARTLQYYDLASANMRDWPALAENVDLKTVKTYYAAMAGIVVGTECVKGLIEVNNVPLGSATPLLMIAFTGLLVNDRKPDELTGVVGQMFDGLSLDLNDPNQHNAVYFALQTGAQWTEGIAGTGMVSLGDAAEITRISFARLCPIEFND